MGLAPTIISFKGRNNTAPKCFVTANRQCPAERIRPADTAGLQAAAERHPTAESPAADSPADTAEPVPAELADNPAADTAELADLEAYRQATATPAL